jgi:hypothetical protein
MATRPKYIVESVGEVPCVAAHAGDWEHAEDVASDLGTFFLATVREVIDPQGTSA